MLEVEGGLVSVVRQPDVVGIADMYLLWHSELKPPVVLASMGEVKVYIQLMRCLGKGTPRWVQLEDDWFESNDI